MLRNALAGGVQFEESSSMEGLEPSPSREGQRLEHYELVMDKDGQPVELGRGAMGITYKAVDVDLQCPVTLKVVTGRTSW